MVEITLPIVLQILQTAGILVGIIYYLTIMRNSQRNQELSRKAQEQALETRQAQLFMNIYNQSFANREWLGAYSKVMSTQWDDYDAHIRQRNEDNEYLEASNYLSSFYEGLGVFVKEGLVDIRMVALTMTYMTTRYWERIAPIVYEGRKRNNYPRFLSEFEYLYDELVKYLDEHPELKT
jgi:hypothetical protein